MYTELALGKGERGPCLGRLVCVGPAICSRCDWQFFVICISSADKFCRSFQHFADTGLNLVVDVANVAKFVGLGDLSESLNNESFVHCVCVI